MNTSNSLCGQLHTTADNFVSATIKLPCIDDSIYIKIIYFIFVKHRYSNMDTQLNSTFGSRKKIFIRHDYKYPIRRGQTVHQILTRLAIRPACHILWAKLKSVGSPGPLNHNVIIVRSLMIAVTHKINTPVKVHFHTAHLLLTDGCCLNISPSLTQTSA